MRLRTAVMAVVTALILSLMLLVGIKASSVEKDSEIGFATTTTEETEWSYIEETKPTSPIVESTECPTEENPTETTVPSEDPTEDPEDTQGVEEPTEETAPSEEPTEPVVEYTMYYTSDDVTMLAKLLYRECRGIASDTEKACVVWTVLNRVDAGYSNTISGVITAPNQYAWNPDTPIWEELYDLSEDVLIRWSLEKNGLEDVGRVLPSDYLWFCGDGVHNYFRNAYQWPYDMWDYSLSSPYDD